MRTKITNWRLVLKLEAAANYLDIENVEARKGLHEKAQAKAIGSGRTVHITFNPRRLLDDPNVHAKVYAYQEDGRGEEFDVYKTTVPVTDEMVVDAYERVLVECQEKAHHKIIEEMVNTRLKELGIV